ncbi:MAG TPA: hypothetical protein VGL76_04280 [Gaiellaceae bacterium]|jgi:hypothetical protein
MRLPRIALPVAAWVAATVAYCAVAVAKGYSPLRPVTWARFDSYQYLTIAHRGYFVEHCHPPDQKELCGDAGWFPGYSWLIHALGWLGLPPMQTAAVVAWFFALATVVLIWEAVGRTASVAVAFAAFAPGRIYDYALFPLSLVTTFSLLHLLALLRDRTVIAAVAGFFAALMYPAGLVLAVTSGAWLVLQRRYRDAVIVTTAVATAGGLIVFVQRLQTGHWDVYLRVQAHYHHRLQEPFGGVARAVRVVFEGFPFRIDAGPALQTVLVTAVLIATTLAARTRSDLLIVLFGVGTWLLAESLTAVSNSRDEAALLPLAVLLPRVPRWLAAALLACAVWLTVPMTELFLSSRLL